MKYHCCVTWADFFTFYSLHYVWYLVYIYIPIQQWIFVWNCSRNPLLKPISRRSLDILDRQMCILYLKDLQRTFKDEWFQAKLQHRAGLSAWLLNAKHPLGLHVGKGSALAGAHTRPFTVCGQLPNQTLTNNSVFSHNGPSETSGKLVLLSEPSHHTRYKCIVLHMV